MTSLALPWTVRRRRLATPLLILPGIIPGSSKHLSVNAVSFGSIVIEVRPTTLRRIVLGAERRIIWVLPKVFAGELPFSEPAFLDMFPKISDGTRPDLPQGAQELGLTDSLWEIAVRCLCTDPAQQPNMTEVVGLLRELLMPSLSLEADLLDFFKACMTWGGGDPEKAQKFADELDEVRHTGMHNVHSSHHESRHSTAQVFFGKTGRNIRSICKRCVAILTSFRPRFCSRKNPLNWRLLPSPRTITGACSRPPSTSALL